MHRLLVIVATALVVAGCGTTVPLSQRSATTGQQGLGSSTGATPSSGRTNSTPDLGGDPAPASGTTRVTIPVTGGSSMSSGGGSSNGSSTRATVAGTTGTASGSGATSVSVTGPLQVGITYIDNSQSSQALGVSNPASVTGKTAAEAFVRGFNLRGGLDGRKIDPVEYSFNGDAADYTTEATAACDTFTEDTHVTVVLDNAFGTIGGFRDCLQKAGVMDITAQDEGDAATSAKDPLHANTGYLTTDATYAAVIKQTVASGYLTAKNQIGVIVENCAENTTAYGQTILPLIERMGLKAPKETKINCTAGFASAGAAASAISSDILTFRSAGVDRVMFVSANESVALLLFASDASSQGYTPGYLLSSVAQPEALAPQLPADQRPQLHGVGNAPTNDVDGATPTTVEKQCLAIARAGGLASSSYADDDFLYPTCALDLLLQTALHGTHGKSTATALGAAIDDLGTSFVAPGLVDNMSSFSSIKHDAPDEVRPFGYVVSCSCMRYSGPAVPA